MQKRQAKQIAALFYKLNLAFKNPSMRQSQVIHVQWDILSGVFNPEVRLDTAWAVMDLATRKSELIVKEVPERSGWTRVSYWIESVEFYAEFPNDYMYLYRDGLPIEEK